MGFKCGIVGLPNVGKSTLFNALTKAGIAAENFPFCTIEPNVGVVAVPDPRLDALAVIVKPERVVPASMEFVDIAGLVEGASKGEGLGNKFLSHIRETDAIAFVARCFEDDNIVHVSGSVDPVRDLDTVQTELVLADLETAEKALQRVQKLAKSGNKEAVAEKALLERVGAHLDQGHALRGMEANEDEQKLLKPLCFLSMKPAMVIANVDEEGHEESAHFVAVRQWAEQEGAVVVPVCAAVESELADMSDEEKVEFLHELGWDEPGLNRVIRGGYALLGLQTYFTAGVKEVRAWTIRKGDTAPKAAGVIHTDFEKGFIRAEVIAYEEFIAHQGEQGAKEAGKARLEGKEYVMHDGDVVHFRFNV